MNAQNSHPKLQLSGWWGVWAAFLFGIFQVYYFLGMNAPASRSAASPVPDPFLAALGLLPVAVSVVVRWSILPQIQKAQAALPFFIVGLALAEASCFIGLFIFPAYKEGFFVFSIIGMFQFIPFFARRYFAEDTHH